MNGRGRYPNAFRPQTRIVGLIILVHGRATLGNRTLIILVHGRASNSTTVSSYEDVKLCVQGVLRIFALNMWAPGRAPQPCNRVELQRLKFRTQKMHLVDHSGTSGRACTGQPYRVMKVVSFCIQEMHDVAQFIVGTWESL